MKVCRDCNIEKPFTYFSARKNPYQTKTQYYISFCKPCMVKRAQKWQNEHKEQYKAYLKSYYTKKNGKPSH